MSTRESLASIGAAAEELGYGVLELTRHRVVLVARQADVKITIEQAAGISGEDLRLFLVPIPHWSGTSYNEDFARNAL